MGSNMGPTWDLFWTKWVPDGLPLLSHIGFANEFGMGPTWVQLWDPRGTYLVQHGSHADYHYGTHMGFANDFGMGSYMDSDMGPTWDLFGTTWVP